MSDTPENIVEMRLLKREGPVSRKPSWEQSGSRCYHKFIEVDDDHCVFCQTCGKQLDPGKAIWDLACHYWREDTARETLSALNKRLTEGKAEEERLKARIARAKKTLRELGEEP